MDKIKFETRAISIFRDYKYVFHDELQQSEVLKKMSVSERAALITLGSLGGLAVNFSYSADSEARLELTKLVLPLRKFVYLRDLLALYLDCMMVPHPIF